MFEADNSHAVLIILSLQDVLINRLLDFDCGLLSERTPLFPGSCQFRLQCPNII